MKTIIRTIGLALLVILTLQTFAQVPQKMNYQAVARDASGNALSNKTIGLKFTVRETTASGPDLFAETMTATTNSMGTFNVEIGGGTAVLGSFATISWSSGPKFLNIKIDPNGGSSYTDMGSYQLLSVAYAQYAKNVLNNDDADANPTNELQNLTIAGNQLSISSGNTVTLPTGGGSATPGGANGNVQFNSAGAFGGDAALNWDNTSKRLIVTNSGTGQMYLKGTSTWGGLELDGANGWAQVVLSNNGTQKWRLVNNPLAGNTFNISLANDDYKFTVSQDGKVGVGVGMGSSALEGQMEVRSNSTVTVPTLLLKESEADFSRLMFKNTNATKNWTIAGSPSATDANSILNFWYWNGTSGNDVMSILGSGRVGIGTTNPQYSLSINGGGDNSEVHLTNTTSGTTANDGVRFGLSGSGANSWIWNYENGEFYIGTNNSKRFTILGNGNVGIGTGTPAATLEVIGTTQFGNEGKAFSELKEITGTTAGVGTDHVIISYPAGYTAANIRVLSCEINYDGNSWLGLGGANVSSATTKIFYYLGPSDIWIYYNNAISLQSKAFRMLVMKM